LEKSALISIVISCYNDSKYVEQAVYSALDQTYVNKEVIVIDDGSDEETKAVLKRLEPKITKLITQDNKGQSAARNRGIQEAMGEYILILDSDDYFDSTFIEKAIVFFGDNEVKIVTCQARLLFDDNSSYIYIPPGGNMKNFLINNGALGTSLFKKQGWYDCGGYDEGMREGFEDWEFFIRILKDGGVTEVIQEPLYMYRKRSNTTTARANKVKYRLLNYIYLKHRELFIAHFDDFVFQLLQKVEGEETEKIKNTQRVEFKVGHTILKPLRWIKKCLK